MKILCVGEASFNTLLPVNEFIKENKNIKINEEIVSGGGCAYTSSLLLARWGLDTYLASSLGNDYRGNYLKEELSKGKVNTKYVYQDNDNKTASSYIINSKLKETNTKITYRTNDLNYKEILKLDESFDYVLLDGYDLDAALDAIKQNEDAKIMLNANFKNENILKLARHADYIVASKDFAEEYTGKKIDLSDFKTLIEIYNEIKDAFKKANIVIVLDDNSSFTYQDGYKLIKGLNDSDKKLSEAFNLYQGAFLYFIAKKEDILTAMRKAALASSTCMPSIVAVNQRFDDSK